MPRYYLIFLLAALGLLLPVTSTISQASSLPEAKVSVFAYDQLSAPLAASWWPLSMDLDGGTEVIAIDKEGNIFAGGENSSRIAGYGEEEVAKENLASGYPDIEVLPNPNYNARYPLFRVFPSPTRDGRLQVQGLPLAQRIEVRVFDEWGNNVRRQLIRRRGIEMGDLPDGLYIIKFEFGGEYVFAQVQVQRAAP